LPSWIEIFHEYRLHFQIPPADSVVDTYVTTDASYKLCI
jgi:hypothetical protein